MISELAENSPKRRDKLVIMAEILGIARKGTSKTHIMFKANLSFSQLKQYLSLLSRTGLLEKTSYDGKILFQATPKGMEFMEKQQELIELLNEDSNEYRNCVKTSPLILGTFHGNKHFLSSIHKAPRF